MSPAPASYGKTSLHRWASLRSELLWIYDGPIAAGSPKEEVDHRIGYWAWLIRRGSVRAKWGEQTLEAKAGQWMISPQDIVTQEFSPDAVLLSVHFLCQWPTGDNLFAGKKGSVFSASDFPRLARSGVALSRLVHRYFPGITIDFSLQAVDYSVFLRFQKLFCQWLADFHEAWMSQGRGLAKAGEGDARLLRAVQCLNETPLTDDFPAMLLQKETGLGRAHLDRLFWKDYNVTTREYWERLREESAIRNLQVESLSIKEIGYHLGFKQASHFTKWFTRRVGVTPKAYRDRGSRSWVI
jgi:AraC-like DNA-binding protein